MPPAIVAFASKYGIYLAISALVAVILTLAYCEGHKAGKSGEVVNEQRRTIQVQQEIGTANENAAGARVADATKAVSQGKELSDALNSSADPDHQRIVRGCAILRQQHRDTKNIPACR